MAISIFAMIFSNYIMRLDFYYGSQLFLIQLPIKYLIINVLLLVIITYIFKKYFNSNYIKILNLGTYQIFFLIVIISIIFKLLLLGFNLQYDTSADLISKIFEQQRFNQYKLYSYIALAFSKIFYNYEYFLIVFNIFLSSIAIGLIFLILNEISASVTTIYLTTLFTLLYVPLNLIDILMRVDTLFFFLLMLSIYLGIRNMNDSKVTNIILFISSIFLLCICRESTLYLLPLFLVFTIFESEKKILSSLFLTMIILLTTSYLSNLNKTNHGFSSYVRDYHLIYNMQHYGYFNEQIMTSYKNKLSPDALNLLNDINQSYISSVPPHKRAPFDHSHIGGILGEYWYLIRPDYENVVTKSTHTKYKGNFVEAKQAIINSIENLPEIFDINQLDKEIILNRYKLKNEDRDLYIFIKDQLINVFLLKTYSRSTSINMACISDDNNVNITFVRDCVKKKAVNIHENYINNQSDNWSYKRSILHNTWKFDDNTKKYIQHPNIDKVTEIVLAIPSLYIVQSALTLFGMSGYVPVTSGIGLMGDVYNQSFFPKIFTIYFQALYTFIMNFWYIFCLIAIINAFLNVKDKRRKIQEIIMGMIPLYYISFIVFAAQFEFSRLITPVIPFIIYCFFSSMIIIFNIRQKDNMV